MGFPSGVPALLNLTALPFELMIEARALASLVIKSLEPPYGIYLKDKIAIQADGFLEFSVTGDSQIANYRIEQGAFSTFNKVISPEEYRLVIVKEINDDTFMGAFDSELGMITRKTGTFDFLNLIKSISDDLNLYDIFTPERTFINCNVKRYDYRRVAEEGSNILIIGLIFTEIVNTEDAAFSAPPTKTQAGQPMVSGGQVTAQKPVVA